MTEHTILVAFTVEADTREDAHRNLPLALPRPGTYYGGRKIASWWVAEDDRDDGSDCDSAVFVKPGAQYAAHYLLLRAGYTEGHNHPDHNATKMPWEPPEGAGELDIITRAAAVLAGQDGAEAFAEDDLEFLRRVMNICAWCRRDMTDEVCPNAKDICVDCCGED